MNVGITGASGFIGKYLVEALKKEKNVKLSRFDLPQQNLLNPKHLEKFVVNKDIVIHAAAVNRGTNTEIIASSVVGTYNLISAIKKHRKQIKLIFLSSTQAENETVFGLSKRLAEIMFRDFSKKYKKPVTVFRVTNVFGSGCRPFYNSVVATFCYQVANNKKTTITDGAKKINFIYVKDLAGIIKKEIFIRRTPTFYFKKLTTRNLLSVKRLVRIVNSFKNIKSSQKIKSKFRKDLYNTFLSYSK